MRSTKQLIMVCFLTWVGICGTYDVNATTISWDMRDGVTFNIDINKDSTVDGWATTKTKEGWRYTRRTDQSSIMDGRTYPGVVSTDQAVVIDIRPFQKDGGKEQDWCAHASRRSPFVGCAIRSGFLILTRAHLSGGSSIFVGSEFDASYASLVREALTGAAGFYANRLRTKRDYLAVVYTLPTEDAMCRYVGGVLQGLLLLGVSHGCVEAGPLSNEMDHFFSHETFHLWNYPLAPLSAKDPLAMLFLEGSAEFAADLRQEASRGGEIFRDRVSGALFQCANNDSKNRPTLVQQVSKDPHVAYVCGTALMFGLSGGRSDQYFTMIHSLLIGEGDADLTQRLQSVVIAPSATSLWATFNNAGSWLSHFRDATAFTGIRLDIDSEPTGQQAQTIAVAVMRDVLRNDCQGSYGLYTGKQPKVDPNLKGCTHVRPGLHPQALAGFDLLLTPMAARRAWLEACRTRMPVRMTYAEGVSSDVKCEQEHVSDVVAVKVMEQT